MSISDEIQKHQTKHWIRKKLGSTRVDISVILSSLVLRQELTNQM